MNETTVYFVSDLVHILVRESTLVWWRLVDIPKMMMRWRYLVTFSTRSNNKPGSDELFQHYIVRAMQLAGSPHEIASAKTIAANAVPVHDLVFRLSLTTCVRSLIVHYQDEFGALGFTVYTQTLRR